MFGPKTKVLIVDDMSTVQNIISRPLKDIGFNDIAEAAGGGEAISRTETPFGLIESDWNMPNGSDIDLSKRVRADQRVGITPFMLVTAETGHIRHLSKNQLLEKLEVVHKKYA